MSDFEHKLKELHVKYLQLLISACGFIAVVFSIVVGLNSQTEAINNQWKQKFYDEKIELYLRATELAGKIAGLKRISEQGDSANEINLQSTIVEFRSLYWGSMAVLEGKNVENAMVKFNQGLVLKLEAKKLEQLALYLAHVSKNEAQAEYQHDPQLISRYGISSEILLKMDAILGGNQLHIE